jgi:23S rRNA pseudouridine1911/1915/1917 synthase
MSADPPPRSRLDVDDLGDDDPGVVQLHPTREQTNLRLDRFVADSLPDLSRSYIQQLIAAGLIRVDAVARRASFKMTPGEVVTVSIPPPVVDHLLPEPIPLAVLYEDADVIVLDKPAGLVVHPAPGHPRGTLVNALLAHAPDISVGGTNRPGIVHRLDKDTSGLMVVAKTDRARNSLTAQWEERSVEKAYVALAAGVVEPDRGTIDAPIARDPAHRQRMAVVARGRFAVTHFDVRRRFADSSLLDLAIETGRTHQIRVHLAFIGHPVVSDPVYGRTVVASGLPVPRQFLHAARLAFRLPDGRAVAFEAPLPPDLQDVLDRLSALQPALSDRG